MRGRNPPGNESPAKAEMEFREALQAFAFDRCEAAHLHPVSNTMLI